MDKRIFVLIPSRGGSKGVPRKALKPLGNKPLIAHTIDYALELGGRTKVHVNTDDAEIQDVACSLGADIPFLRPEELARDDSDLVEAVKHASLWYRQHQDYVYDIIIIMSPTYPFRRPGLVRDALVRGLDDPGIFNIGSVGPVSQDIRNYWQMGEHGPCRYMIPGAHEIKQEDLIQSSLSFNIVYEFRENNHLRTPVILNDIEAIDIDEPEDLERARAVVGAGLYPFPAGMHE
ncbi:MAG: acylneuraminate cytidylyltransferase family protein [Proteobacteria bacterium]|nr:acylneuraminate cytidylyltransferase family protein [Pseudomonadota bacterium]